MDVITPDMKKAIELLALHGYTAKKIKTRSPPEFLYLIYTRTTIKKWRQVGQAQSKYRAVFWFQEGKLPHGTQKVAKIRIADLKWIEAENFKAPKKGG